MDYEIKKLDKELIKKAGKCAYCECNYEPFLTIDHIQPKCRDGPDDSKNKQACCWSCNQLKGPLTHKEFKLYRKSILDMISLGKIYLNFSNSSINLNFKERHYPPEEFHKENSDGEEE